ncbi:hypothetical protein ACLOJK_034223 [Asimina triloba]
MVLSDQRVWTSLLSKKVMLRCVSFARKRNTKIVLNLPDSVPEWKFWFFYARFEEAVTPEELKRGQRRLWNSSNRTALNGIQQRGPFLRWYQGHPLLGFQALLPMENWRDVHAAKHQVPCRALVRLPGGCRLRSFIAQITERSRRSVRKRRNALLRGPTTLSKEAQESLARQDEENLQASLALFYEAHRSGLLVASPEASMDSVSLELGLLESMPPPILARDIGADTTSPIPILEPKTSEALDQEGVGADIARAQGSRPMHDADQGEVKAHVHRGVLGSIFEEVSFCPFGEQVFHRPFDMEARAMKILGDLLPELLEQERICLIDGCSSRIEYRYHLLGKHFKFPMGRSHALDQFGVSNITDKERRKIIVARKRPEEVGVEQVSREVLRPDISVHTEKELLDEVFAKVRGIARERLESERVELDGACDDAKGISLAKQDLERALAEVTTEADNLHLQKFSVKASLQRLSSQVEHAQGKTSRLSSELDVVQTEQDEAVGRIAAAEENVLQSSTKLVALRSKTEALRARGADLEACVSSNSGESDTDTIWLYRILFGGGQYASRYRYSEPWSTLQERITVLSSRESELLAESKTMRAEVARLRTELKTLRVKRLQVASTHGGDTLFSGSISVDTRASIIAEYLQSDIHQ